MQACLIHIQVVETSTRVCPKYLGKVKYHFLAVIKCSELCEVSKIITARFVSTIEDKQISLVALY